MKVSFENTQVIILTAGKGERLRPLTNHIPKSLLRLFGKTLLDHNIQALFSLGLTHVTLVTGHGHAHVPPHFHRVYNASFETTNMAYSLLETGCVDPDKNVLVLYGDCVYEVRILYSLLKSAHDIMLSIDQNWLSLWHLRFEDPLSDCETLRLEGDYIVDIGKKPNHLLEMDGQYTGLFFIAKDCIENFQRVYHDLKQRTEDPKKLFLTDVFQHWIDQKNPLYAHRIQGGWLECDQHSDITLYETLFQQNKLKCFYHVDPS